MADHLMAGPQAGDLVMIIGPEFYDHNEWLGETVVIGGRQHKQRHGMPAVALYAVRKPAVPYGTAGRWHYFVISSLEMWRPPRTLDQPALERWLTS